MPSSSPSNRTAELAIIRRQPSPVRRPRPPVRAAWAADSLVDPQEILARDPHLAGGLIWESSDAANSPIGWALAREVGTPVSGYYLRLWKLNEERNAVIAEAASL